MLYSPTFYNIFTDKIKVYTERSGSNKVPKKKNSKKVRNMGKRLTRTFSKSTYKLDKSTNNSTKAKSIKEDIGRLFIMAAINHL
jgi:hypothetical protein